MLANLIIFSFNTRIQLMFWKTDWSGKVCKYQSLDFEDNIFIWRLIVASSDSQMKLPTSKLKIIKIKPHICMNVILKYLQYTKWNKSYGKKLCRFCRFKSVFRQNYETVAKVFSITIFHCLLSSVSVVCHMSPVIRHLL